MGFPLPLPHNSRPPHLSLPSVKKVFRSSFRQIPTLHHSHSSEISKLQVVSTIHENVTEWSGFLCLPWTQPHSSGWPAADTILGFGECWGEEHGEADSWDHSSKVVLDYYLLSGANKNHLHYCQWRASRDGTSQKWWQPSKPPSYQILLVWFLFWFPEVSLSPLAHSLYWVKILESTGNS